QGWVVRVSVAEQWNETQHYHFVGFRSIAQPNLHFLNRQVLGYDVPYMIGNRCIWNQRRSLVDSSHKKTHLRGVPMGN
ncbi:hypothetical protein QHH03_06590, partial [Aphanizomenon sp. 202]|nr:hypothetical protein [Aphanizomenon sp. 202]